MVLQCYPHLRLHMWSSGHRPWYPGSLGARRPSRPFLSPFFSRAPLSPYLFLRLGLLASAITYVSVSRPRLRAITEPHPMSSPSRGPYCDISLFKV